MGIINIFRAGYIYIPILETLVTGIEKGLRY